MAEVTSNNDAITYRYDSARPSHMHEIFVPAVLRRLKELSPQRVLDLGCGNGSLCRAIAAAGIPIEGVDPSEKGIEQAKLASPGIQFTRMSIYDEPPEDWIGKFDAIVSTEVVEHLYDPRAMARLAARLLKPGGRILVTTPYHGYLKNLVLSILGKWDFHHSPLWDHGHIKFWSRKTLSQLFEEFGFMTCSFKGLGRFPFLWMTMLMEFQSPSSARAS